MGWAHDHRAAGSRVPHHTPSPSPFTHRDTGTGRLGQVPHSLPVTVSLRRAQEPRHEALPSCPTVHFPGLPSASFFHSFSSPQPSGLHLSPMTCSQSYARSHTRILSLFLPHCLRPFSAFLSDFSHLHFSLSALPLAPSLSTFLSHRVRSESSLSLHTPLAYFCIPSLR